MAQLKKHILGEVTGGLGDVVFKKIKGENYIASRPTDYTMDMKSEAVQRRARFRIAMKLAQSMNKSLRLKAIWKSKAPEGLSAFNFMMQRNYPYVQAETIANGIKLTPDVGFGVLDRHHRCFPLALPSRSIGCHVLFSKPHGVRVW